MIGYSSMTILSFTKQLNMPKSRKKNKRSAAKKIQEEKRSSPGANSLQEVDVKGIGPVHALIDTGCNGCAIRRDFLPDAMISKIIQKSGTGTLFDGSKADFSGRIDLLVTCLGKKVKMRFFVTDALSFPLILGASWIRKSRAILQSDGTTLGVKLGGERENKGVKKNCPSPYVPVHVDEIGLSEVSALVDTGCRKSSVRKDLLSNLHMSKAIPSSTNIILANNQQVELLESIGLNVTYQGVTTYIERVHVVSKMDDPFVLGMDWIHKTRVVIESDGSQILVSQKPFEEGCASATVLQFNFSDIL